MSDKWMSFVTTGGPVGASASRRTSLPRLLQEPQNLWPSKRGTEIAHIEASLASIEAGMVNRLPPLVSAAVYEAPDNSQRAILLNRLAGKSCVSIVEEPDHAPGLLAVIADAASDREPILSALREMLDGIALVNDSELDRPFGT